VFTGTRERAAQAARENLTLVTCGKTFGEAIEEAIEDQGFYVA
jgi:hypothetical protein